MCDFGGADLGVVGRGHELGNDRRGQDADDDDHHHDFDQRESRATFVGSAIVFSYGFAFG